MIKGGGYQRFTRLVLLGKDPVKSGSFPHDFSPSYSL